MFHSVKRYVTIPYSFKSFLSYSGTGAKQYSGTTDSLCYPVVAQELVRSNTGVEEISTTHLYIDGADSITVNDTVVFEGKEWPIKTIVEYYMGGSVDIKVVYL